LIPSKSYTALIGANGDEISVLSIIKAMLNMVGSDFHKYKKKSVAFLFWKREELNYFFLLIRTFKFIM
jgi:hypothetical protein